MLKKLREYSGEALMSVLAAIAIAVLTAVFFFDSAAVAIKAGANSKDRFVEVESDKIAAVAVISNGENGKELNIDVALTRQIDKKGEILVKYECTEK